MESCPYLEKHTLFFLVEIILQIAFAHMTQILHLKKYWTVWSSGAWCPVPVSIQHQMSKTAKRSRSWALPPASCKHFIFFTNTPAFQSDSKNGRHSNDCVTGIVVRGSVWINKLPCPLQSGMTTENLQQGEKIWGRRSLRGKWVWKRECKHTSYL